MESMKESRIEWIDQLRGLAILFVVVGHLIHFNNFGVDHPLAEIIWSFHMLLFFAISGYVAELTTRIESFHALLLNIRKKLISIGLPWVVWGLVVNKWFFTSEWPTYTLSEITGFWNSTWLWFLGALLWISLVFAGHKYILGKLNNRYLQFFIPLLVTIILTAILILLKLRDMNQFLWTIGFYMGVYMKRYNQFYRFCSTKAVVVVALLFFVVVSGHWRWFGSSIDDIYKVTCSISAIIVFFYLFANQQHLFHKGVKNMLSLFGINSLLIYVLQFYMTAILPVNDYFVQLNPIILFLLAMAIAIAISYVCVWVAKLIKCFPVLDLFFLGNHKAIF